jgi:sulfite reductase beta subunit-like hemoprotein
MRARASLRNDIWAPAPTQRWLRRAASRVDLGLLNQADGRAALTAMPRLARLDPDQLDALAALAPEIRLSAWRTITLVDLDPLEVAGALAELQSIGLIVDPNSGWVGLSACAGKGACAKARFDVRAEAARRAALREAAGGGHGLPAEHWAGCDRHCGRPDGVEVLTS